MGTMKDNDPLEKLLRGIPLESTPAQVKERLLRRAAWTKSSPSSMRWLISLGIAIVITVSFMIFQSEPAAENATGEPVSEPAPAEASPAVIAERPSAGSVSESAISAQAFGGWSSRILVEGPSFQERFAQRRIAVNEGLLQEGNIPGETGS